jgi:hypothetical protein
MIQPTSGKDISLERSVSSEVHQKRRGSVKSSSGKPSAKPSLKPRIPKQQTIQ